MRGMMNCFMVLFNDMGNYEVTAAQREKGQAN